MHSPDKTELDNLLNQVWEDYRTGDKAALDNIFDQLMPFCLSVSSKTCGRYINEYDEEASIARLAILEAMEKYDPVKGSYIVFLGQVIRSRIIDYKRKEKKQSLIPFTFFSRNGSNLTEDVDDNYFELILDDLARKQEITRLEKLLVDFNICFTDLAQVSPRQRKSKHSAYEIASLIAKEPELSTYLFEKKMPPMREMEDKWKLNRKLADRYRKFIIAAALIELNDFPYLKSYLLPLQGGDKNAC